VRYTFRALDDIIIYRFTVRLTLTLSQSINQSIMYLLKHTTNRTCHIKYRVIKEVDNSIRQELSSCWDGRPFGHNRHGPKSCDGLLLLVFLHLRYSI